MHKLQKDWPELHSFLISDRLSKAVDEYGASYLRGVDQAYLQFGNSGLSMQLVYISNNLKRGNSAIDRELIAWSRKVDK